MTQLKCATALCYQLWKNSQNIWTLRYLPITLFFFSTLSQSKILNFYLFVVVWWLWGSWVETTHWKAQCRKAPHKVDQRPVTGRGKSGSAGLVIVVIHRGGYVQKLTSVDWYDDVCVGQSNIKMLSKTRVPCWPAQDVFCNSGFENLIQSRCKLPSITFDFFVRLKRVSYYNTSVLVFITNLPLNNT